MKRFELKGRTAIVTGAASGIGRALATVLARRGCHLAIADVDDPGLAETEAMAAARDVRISRHHLDVSDRDAVAAFPREVAAAHPRVDVLVNNAGIALGGRFVDVAEDDFERLIAVNFFGVVRMTRAFLPALGASDDARIVNLSSIFGIVAPPGQTAYCASKFAVRGFSESLRKELAGTSVGVTVIHPGGVKTSIARSAKPPAGAGEKEIARSRRTFERALKMPPEEAAEHIVAGIEARKDRVLVGTDAKLASLLERIVPTRYWDVLKRL